MRTLRYVCLFAGGLCLLVRLIFGQGNSTWHDPSPHLSLIVTVEEGVRLEVLDWGGEGRPVVLIAGLGNTAHIFDELAVKTFRPLSCLRHHQARLRSFKPTVVRPLGTAPIGRCTGRARLAEACAARADRSLNSWRRALKRAPGGVRLVIIPGANHHLFISNEDDVFASCVRSWLE